MILWFENWEQLLWDDGRATAFALIGLAALTALELWIPAEPGQGWRGRGRNLVYLALFKVLGLGGIAFWFTFGPILGVARPEPSGFERVAFVFLNLLTIDFFFYWYHRAQHRFSFLWAIHELHHADAELNATTGYRTYWLEAPVQTILVMTPTLLLFGWRGSTHGLIVLTCSLFFLLFAHANLRLSLGPLGSWIIGPQVHRIHHSRRPEEQNRNFAQYFPFLDRLFGSFYAPGRDEYPRTGTEGLASDASIGRAMLQPFRIWAASFRRP
ncbi:MAG: sterol desaturase family protein [bacterium]|nr:sterol desaturase family protein [bacterium]